MVTSLNFITKPAKSSKIEENDLCLLISLCCRRCRVGAEIREKSPIIAERHSRLPGEETDDLQLIVQVGWSVQTTR